MEKELRILMLEDNPIDAELEERELRNAGIAFVSRRVESREDFVRELEAFRPDLVLSDYKLPSYDGLSALAHVRPTYPDLPFIFVTGALGEEQAVDTLLSGATDYVLKERLFRLGTAVSRTLAESEERTKRKQAEEKLFNAAREWRYSFDAIGDFVTLLDREGKIVRCNRAMASFLRRPFNDIIGRPHYNLIYGASGPGDGDLFDRMLKSGRRETLVVRLNERWFNVAADPLSDETGAVTGAVHIMSDITERKRAEEALRDSQNRLQAILDNSPALIFLKDAEGRYLQINRQFERSFNLTREQILDHTDDELFPPDEAAVFRANDRRVIAAGSMQEFEEIASYGDGRHTSIVYKFPLHDIAGSVYAVGGIAVDITVRKEMEEALKRYSGELEEKVLERTREYERAKTMAENASKAKSDFLANMSHELRTPLNSVIGFSEILQDELFGPLNERQRETIGYIDSSGHHLLDLINEILDLSKIEAGRMEMEPALFSLRIVLNESLALLSEKAMRRRITLDLSVEPEADREIEADERKLKQIIFNLLGNAVKFTPEGGSVQVNARRVRSSEFRVQSEGISSELITHNSKLDADLIEISVVDTGIGIKPEDMPRLFHEFTQLQSAYTKEYEGTGLGLALTKKLVELHGGTIWAASEFGKGSTFTFVIPVRQRADEQAAQQAA